MKTLLQRFEEKFSPEPNSGCWLWTGCLSGGRYGGLRVNGRMERAHRVSYKLYKGPIPEGMFVLHKCDIPSCVNPNHLFLGTHADNMAGRNAKNRQAKLKGESHGCAKLTAAAVLEIRRILKTCGRTPAELSVIFDVSQMTISRIKRDQNWQHL